MKLESFNGTISGQTIYRLIRKKQWRHLLACKGKLINIFGHKLPKESVLLGFSDLIDEMQQQNENYDFESIFSDLKNTIMWRMGTLERHHARSVKYESELETRPVDDAIKVVLLKGRSKAINDLLVSMVELFGSGLNL